MDVIDVGQRLNKSIKKKQYWPLFTIPDMATAKKTTKKRRIFFKTILHRFSALNKAHSQVKYSTEIFPTFVDKYKKFTLT